MSLQTEKNSLARIFPPCDLLGEVHIPRCALCLQIGMGLAEYHALWQRFQSKQAGPRLWALSPYVGTCVSSVFQQCLAWGSSHSILRPFFHTKFFQRNLHGWVWWQVYFLLISLDLYAFLVLWWYLSGKTDRQAGEYCWTSWLFNINRKTRISPQHWVTCFVPSRAIFVRSCFRPTR